MKDKDMETTHEIHNTGKGMLSGPLTALDMTADIFKSTHHQTGLVQAPLSSCFQVTFDFNTFFVFFLHRVWHLEPRVRQPARGEQKQRAENRKEVFRVVRQQEPGAEAGMRQVFSVWAL